MEGGNELIKTEETRSIEEIIKSRFEQSDSSKLAEYITGLKPDNPKMVERLIEDQKILRERYKLLDKDVRLETPGDYENYLRKIAQLNDIQINPKSDCGSFFENYSDANAVYLSGGKIGVNIDKNNKDKYSEDLLHLEHEIIHGLQDKYYPNKPIELREYEAYVAVGNNEYFVDNPEQVKPVLFDFFMGGSVEIDYKMASERTGEEREPVWKNSEYFLKNLDGISQEKIDNYKNKQQSTSTTTQGLAE
jgi:hypothetical protein